jgi:tetratricopeptide (TPR) repeat protein
MLQFWKTDYTTRKSGNVKNQQQLMRTTCKEKNLVIAETRRKAEKELEALRAKVWRYSLLGIGFGVVLAIPFWLRNVWAGFSIYSFIIFPVIAYIGFKLYVRRFFLHAQEVLETLEKEPHNASDYAARAGTLYAYGYYEASAEDYQTALEMEPDNDLTWFDLAETLWKLHRRSEALPIAENLGKTEGDYQASALVLQGEILTDEDPVTALKCFDKAVEIEPDDYDHHLARLRFYLDTNQLDQAAEAVTKLKGCHLHQYPALFELRGVLALKQGRFADAVRELTSAIRHCSSESKYYRLRSDAHEALGHLDKAEIDRRKAQELVDEL